MKHQPSCSRLNDSTFHRLLIHRSRTLTMPDKENSVAQSPSVSVRPRCDCVGAPLTDDATGAPDPPPQSQSQILHCPEQKMEMFLTRSNHPTVLKASRDNDATSQPLSADRTCGICSPVPICVVLVRQHESPEGRFHECDAPQIPRLPALRQFPRIRPLWRAVAGNIRFT